MSDSPLAPLQDALSKSLVELTRTTAQLAAEDLVFFRSSHPKEAKHLNKSGSKILHLSRKLLQNAAAESTVNVPSYSSVDGLEDSWPAIVEVIDNLLEKTDATLDEFTGVIKRQHEDYDVQPRHKDYRAPLTQQSSIPKPQIHFPNPPPNHPTSTFKPLLRTKPHALVPLAESIATSRTLERQEQYDVNFYLCVKDPSPLKTFIDSSLRHNHPYQAEIEQYQYPDTVRTRREPVSYTPIDDSSADYVDTPEAVVKMVAELKQATEIAVDVEHHEKHSYIGLVSLMQISTREKDWIIDTLQPWRDELQMLNEIFADPSILKVFHGATSDIIWLQRDFGLYIVGLFDTYHACVALYYQKRSLAFLLDKFANFTAQKQYQTADWRTRPLPKELLDYARSDTHYLLYIYDNMRNELVDQSQQLPPSENLVDQVLVSSKKECLQKFEYFQYDAVRGTGRDGWYNMLIRTPALFTRQQFSVFRALHQWRDKVARDEDESINYVMQKHILFDIARHLPTTSKDLHSVAVPMSDLLRGRIDELLTVVRAAIKAGDNGPDMQTFMDEHPETIAYRARQAERKRIQNGVGHGEFAVGNVVRREREQAERDRVPLGDIQAQTSSFWGTTIVSLRRPQSRGQGTESPRLEIPLPPHVIGVEGEGSHPSPVEDTNESNHPRIHDDSAGKSAIRPSKKRKSHAVSETSSPASTNGHGATLIEASHAQASDPMLSDVVALEPDGETKAHATKRARRAALKAEKAERQAQQAAAQQAEAPFDYGSAPSILHAKTSKPASTGVNPYAKSTDTSKGARKGKRDVPAKSMTFQK